MPVLQNAHLRVTLDEACPRMLQVDHFATGEVLLPNSAGDPVAVSVDGDAVFSVADGRCAWAGSGEQARFTWTLQHGRPPRLKRAALGASWMREGGEAA